MSEVNAYFQLKYPPSSCLPLDIFDIPISFYVDVVYSVWHTLGIKTWQCSMKLTGR